MSNRTFSDPGNQRVAVGRRKGMRRHLLVLTIVTVLLTAGCSGSDGKDADGPGSPQGNGDKDRRSGAGQAVEAALLTFDECEPLLDHVRSTASSRVGPNGFQDGWLSFRGERAIEDSTSSAPAADGDTSARSMAGAAEPQAAAPEEGTDYSGTNVQEEGVDEPDIVKTDGETLFVHRGTELIAVDADGAGQVLGRVKVTEDGSTTELLLLDDRVLVLSTTYTYRTMEDDVIIDPDGSISEPSPALPPDGVERSIPVDPGMTSAPTTTLTSVDVSDPANLRITDTQSVEGEYRTARMVDGVARIVLQSPGPEMRWDYPTSDSDGALEQSIERNRTLVERTTLDDWLPHRVDRATGERSDLVGCGDVYVPASFAGSGLVTVLTVPMAGTGPVEARAATLLASADTVYASTDNLYVAAHAWPEMSIPEREIMPPQDLGTDLHRFDITGDVAVHTASGRVEGQVLNQFALSEHEGRLRVAATTTAPWDGRRTDEVPASSSAVTVFEQQGRSLVAVGSVGDLGKGETIRSVRYVGDTAYVVTFRQTDPFYVVDLSDPTAPKMVGELKLPGYSGYLHPIDATHVLGVGQEGDEDGRITGVKVSLFDVSDPSAPVESANWVQEDGQQQVEFDAKAFLYWPATRLAVVPVQVWERGDVGPGGGEEFNGAVGLTVEDDAITELGRIAHTDLVGSPDSLQVERSIVVGDLLWTLSSAGFMSSDLETLAPGTFVALT